jgi:nucleotide-binding universal stress UspA family protein
MRRILALTVGLLGGAGPVLAQSQQSSPAPAGPPPFTAEITVTATTAEEPVGDVPVGVDVVGADRHAHKIDSTLRGNWASELVARYTTTGRPVLVVPAQGAVAAAPRRVVLAWKPSPEAARAVHEVLPLLARDAQVDVLLVDPQVGEGSHGEQPGADIARHLARHGLEVNVVERPREGRSTAQCLLQHAGEVGADLLVMGGYGHHHWRELVLGGTTRSVLRDARLPVFFAH